MRPQRRAVLMTQSQLCVMSPSSFPVDLYFIHLKLSGAFIWPLVIVNDNGHVAHNLDYTGIAINVNFVCKEPICNDNVKCGLALN